MLCAIAVQQIDSDPFHADIIERVRDDLRLTLIKAGIGDGLPQEGDVVQVFEVRLIQHLLEAFEDPDHYFGEWWAKGVWLGAPSRKLPRDPAVFERKTKWRLAESAEEGGGEWQRN